MWRFTHADLGSATVQPPVKLRTDNADVLNPSLVAGLGLALQPEFLVWRDLKAGALEVAMPAWRPPVLGLHLLMPPSSRRPLRVRTLIDHLARSLAHPPWREGSSHPA